MKLTTENNAMLIKTINEMYKDSKIRKLVFDLFHRMIGIDETLELSFDAPEKEFKKALKELLFADTHTLLSMPILLHFWVASGERNLTSTQMEKAASLYFESTRVSAHTLLYSNQQGWKKLFKKLLQNVKQQEEKLEVVTMNSEKAEQQEQQKVPEKEEAQGDTKLSKEEEFETSPEKGENHENVGENLKNKQEISEMEKEIQENMNKMDQKQIQMELRISEYRNENQRENPEEKFREFQISLFFEN